MCVGWCSKVQGYRRATLYVAELVFMNLCSQVYFKVSPTYCHIGTFIGCADNPYFSESAEPTTEVEHYGSALRVLAGVS